MRPNRAQAVARFTESIPDPQRVPWMTPREASRCLGMSVNTVLDLLRRGILPGIDISKEDSARPRWKIATADLRKFLGLD